jgi:phosphoribosylanthranilate isomerase
MQEIIELLKLDFVQLHGEETPELGDLTQYAGVIKSFKLSSEFPVEETLDAMDKYDVDFVLVDREKQGEGETLNWGKVRLLCARKKVFLAGGLNPENISEAVQVAQPFAVDVAGGIETDGEQDIDRIKKFISRAKGIL